MISITGGRLKGHILKVPKGTDVRPTTNRVREAIFNTLQDAIYGSTVLDIFAGSGALGIEALSRGASKAIFVESNPSVCKVLFENLKRCKVLEYSKVVCKHFLQASKILQRHSSVFDLVFADPPYSKKMDFTIFSEVKKLLHKEGIFVFEQASGRKPEFDEKDWTLLKEKHFGSSWVWFFGLKA